MLCIGHFGMLFYFFQLCARLHFDLSDSFYLGVFNCNLIQNRAILHSFIVRSLARCTYFILFNSASTHLLLTSILFYILKKLTQYLFIV